MCYWISFDVSRIVASQGKPDRRHSRGTIGLSFPVAYYLSLARICQACGLYSFALRSLQEGDLRGVSLVPVEGRCRLALEEWGWCPM